jgi:predicted permease
MLTGAFARRKNIIDEHSAQKCSMLISYIVIPATILHSLQTDSGPETRLGFWFAFLLAIIYYILAVPLAALLIPKREGRPFALERLAAIVSNCAFMGFPLVRATLGVEATVYGTAYIAVFNLFIWAWAAISVGGKKPSVKNILLKPQLLSTAVGLVLFSFSIKLPDILNTGIKYIADLNTPLAMLVLGVFIAGADIKKTFSNPRIYRTVFIKNFLISILFVLVIALVHAESWITGTKAPIMAVIIMSAAPTAASTTAISAQYGQDNAYAAQLVASSTLVSIISIALVVLFSEWFV